MATQDVTDPYAECLADEVIASESDASADPVVTEYEDPIPEPEPTIEESVPEPVPEPEPVAEESVPEPEPVIEEPVPEPEPVAEESVPEPTRESEAIVLSVFAAHELESIHTVPIIYVATSEPHDGTWRIRNCVCTII